MSLYLDASALLPLFIQESRTDEAHEHLHGKVLVISDFAIAEFSSGVARRTRTGDIKESDATLVFANFDAWIGNAAWRENLTTGDLANATALIRRWDLGLRAPDALNIAITQRCGAHLLTFDGKMARSARALGVNVVGQDIDTLPFPVGHNGVGWREGSNVLFAVYALPGADQRDLVPLAGLVIERKPSELKGTVVAEGTSAVPASR